jgi:hypothetical protein
MTTDQNDEYWAARRDEQDVYRRVVHDPEATNQARETARDTLVRGGEL